MSPLYMYGKLAKNILINYKHINDWDNSTESQHKNYSFKSGLHSSNVSASKTKIELVSAEGTT